MDISIREAAPLLGRSERAVRAKIRRGELPARRDGRTWRIPLASLPLTAAQRESMQQRGEQARDALDAVLPSRSPIDREHRRRSVADLLPFARGTAGMRIARTGIEPMPRVWRRLRDRLWRRLRARGQFDAGAMQRSLASSAGHFLFG